MSDNYHFSSVISLYSFFGKYLKKNCGVTFLLLVLFLFLFVHDSIVSSAMLTTLLFYMRIFRFS